MATGGDVTGPPRLPENAESRAQSFGTGLAGDPQSAAGVSSLNADSAAYNRAVPHQFTPGSLLTPVGKNPGGLGMSAGDAAKRTFDGTFLGSGNGMAESSYEPSAILKLAA